MIWGIWHLFALLFNGKIDILKCKIPVRGCWGVPYIFSDLTEASYFDNMAVVSILEMALL